MKCISSKQQQFQKCAEQNWSIQLLSAGRRKYPKTREMFETWKIEHARNKLKSDWSILNIPTILALQFFSDSLYLGLLGMNESPYNAIKF